MAEKEKLVKIAGLKREKGYFYYLADFPDGTYVCRSKMEHGRKKKNV